MFEALFSSSARPKIIRADNFRLRVTARNNPVAIYLAEWSFVDADGTPLTQADYDMNAVAASSYYAADWGPQWAFNGIISDGSAEPRVRWQTNYPGEQWIEIGFNRPIDISKYRIHVGVGTAYPNNSEYSLNTWVLEKKNEEGVYETVHTVKNQTKEMWLQGPYREFTF